MCHGVKTAHLLSCNDRKKPVFSQATARCLLTFLGLFAVPVGKRGEDVGGRGCEMERGKELMRGGVSENEKHNGSSV